MPNKEKCKQCHCECHCKSPLHADEYGTCTCDECKCKVKKLSISNNDFWKVMTKRFNK